ncbi:MAG: hypothetical protein L0Y67_01175 [Gammaproteobacteria bacterium]|nr:hypothetical protein [Gammaproteobacteria bacterium]MCI0590216.1 hypothetical protein [Gammaproteobacteria bacterium]
MCHLRYIVMALALFIGTSVSYADVLLIQSIRDSANAPVPNGGLTMAQVEQKYGKPEQQLSPVGDPPITRWLYPNFIVYFEYDRVIHSVAQR